jgi:hypothetical protein
MKYITNIKEYLKPELIDYILNNEGFIKPDSVTGDIVNKYSMFRNLRWESFTSDNLPYELELPFESDSTIHWWFTKLNPGDVFPMHVDTYHEDKNFKRYWVACQDIIEGHVFTYNNTMISDYKLGDVFEFDAGNIMHGACNVGFIPKIALQIQFIPR